MGSNMPRVLIIGTGIAGLFAALRLANEGFEVEIITKQRPKDSSTNWAQGGIAAILDKTNLQEIDGHIKDTLCLLYTSPSPRDTDLSRMPSSA